MFVGGIVVHNKKVHKGREVVKTLRDFGIVGLNTCSGCGRRLFVYDVVVEGSLLSKMLCKNVKCKNFGESIRGEKRWLLRDQERRDAEVASCRKRKMEIQTII